MLRRYLLLSGAHLAAAALGFVAVMVIVERFGPAGLGRASLALALVGYATIVATGGTQLDTLRHAAAAPERVAQLASDVIALRLGLSAASFLGLLGAVFAVSRFAGIEGLTALFGLTLFASAFNISWLPQAQHRAGVLSSMTFGSQVLYVLFLVAFLIPGAGLAAVAAARVLADAVAAAALFLWERGRLGRLPRPSPPRALARTLLEAAPIAGTKLARALTLGSDLLVVGLLLSAEELGRYAAVVKVFLFLESLATAYFIILLPRIAERATKPGEALRREVAGSLLRVSAVSAAVLAVVALGARPLLEGLFGAGFASAAGALRLLALALFVNLVGRHYRQVLLARGRQRADLGVTLVAVAVHVLSKLGLVPRLGVAGAAWGTLLGEVVLLAGLAWLARPELARGPREPLAVPIPAAPFRGERPAP